MESAQEKLKRSVENTGLAEVLQSAASEESNAVQKIALQLRIQPDDTPKWLALVDFLLQEEEEQEEDGLDKWSLHVCKTFMRNEGRLGFVWTIVVSTKGDIKRSVTDVSRAFRIYSSNLKTNEYHAPAAKPAVQRAAQVVASQVRGSDRQPIVHQVGDRIEVDAMPLVGVTEDRNRPNKPGSRGARLIQGG